MSESWEVVLEPAAHGYTIEWVEPNFLLLTRGEVLYKTRSLQDNFTRLGGYPAAWWKRQSARSRLLQRLLRHLYYDVLPLSDGSLFLAFDQSIGIYTDGRICPLQGLVRPCRVLRASSALAQDGNVYFGEYLSNTDRGPMRIYRYTPGSTHLGIAYTFPAGTVRHIHGVYRDPYTDALWCVTGDIGNECRMLRTDTQFRSLEVVGEGDETWRCVSVLFTEDAIYYGTDAEYAPNRVYRIDRKSGKRDQLGIVDGPIYYSYIFDQTLFFAVTAELCPSQQGRSASLWGVSPTGNLQRIFSVEKDNWSVKYFLPGTLHFPRGPGLTTEYYFHCVGLQNADNRTYRVRRQIG